MPKIIRQPPSTTLFSLRAHLPAILLALLILTYTAYFSWYTINRHNTLHSYAADLSLIDQPMWNTFHGGGFMELTWGDHQQPRLAEHFEPILIPLSLLFFIWDDVRILLIAQTLALALGAIPVYWIAKKLLIVNSELLTINYSLFTIHYSLFIHHWAAVAFAAAYLLFPPLQAANIADFHADPFAVTPLLLAFWYASQKRWGWMWLWSIVVMSTKETLPTLTMMLGMWLVWNHWHTRKLQITNITRHSSFINGLLLILVSASWFLVATFGLVAPLARQYFGTDGPVYFAQRYTGGLAGLLPLLQDPARWRYLLGLFAAVGFLPLLAPELLMLGLPVLAANLLSNFSGQYSGEQHYSAPLAAVFVVAAIYGARRLIDNTSLHEKGRQSLKVTALQGVLLWLLAWSLGYHALHGWTPLSVRAETYRPGPASTRLADFTALVPPSAVVSASAALHPHLAHRRIIYSFPTVQEADTLLVDITDMPGVHPNDARAKIMDMLNTNWQVVKAEHGLLLTKKDSAPPASLLPDSFFDFARAQNPPTYPLALAFGDGRLQVVGYDVHDDPDNGVTLRFYWQTSGQLPKDLHLWPLVYDDAGSLLSDPTQVPLPAALWYPPANWRPGETIVTATLPQLLPATFHLGLAVGAANSFSDPAQRWDVTGPQARLYPGRWAQLATFKRQGPFLTLLPPTPTLQPLTEVNASFGPDIRLTGFRVDPPRPRPGATVSILLAWTTYQPLPANYTVFTHLLAADGARVAQNDASPTWLFPQPTTQWRPGQLNLDRHDLKLPDALPPGVYTLQLGLYNAQTMERLSLPDGSNTLSLTQINIK